MAVFSVSGVEPSVTRRQSATYHSIIPKLYLYFPVYLFLKLSEKSSHDSPASFCLKCSGEATLESVKKKKKSFCPSVLCFKRLRN
jgi:hypothetical protein